MARAVSVLGRAVVNGRAPIRFTREVVADGIRGHPSSPLRPTASSSRGRPDRRTRR